MNTISKSFYKDLNRARTAQNKAAKKVSITRLTKSGKPSKMDSDTYFFNNMEEAERFIETFKNNNPGKKIEFRIN